MFHWFWDTEVKVTSYQKVLHQAAQNILEKLKQAISNGRERSDIAIGVVPFQDQSIRAICNPVSEYFMMQFADTFMGLLYESQWNNQVEVHPQTAEVIVQGMFKRLGDNIELYFSITGKKFYADMKYAFKSHTLPREARAYICTYQKRQNQRLKLDQYVGAYNGPSINNAKKILQLKPGDEVVYVAQIMDPDLQDWSVVDIEDSQEQFRRFFIPLPTESEKQLVSFTSDAKHVEETQKHELDIDPSQPLLGMYICVEPLYLYETMHVTKDTQEVPRGTFLNFLEQQGPWIKVKYKGEEKWCAPGMIQQVIPSIPNDFRLVLKLKTLHLWPSENALVKGMMVVGEIVLILGYTDDEQWLMVKSDDAYVFITSDGVLKIPERNIQAYSNFFINKTMRDWRYFRQIADSKVIQEMDQVCASSGQELYSWDHEKRWINHVAFSQDSKYLLVADGGLLGPGGVTIYDVQNHVILHAWWFHSRVVSAAFSRDEQRVLAGGYDALVRLYDIESKKLLYQWEYTNRVNEVVFSPDGKYIVVASEEKDVYVYDAQSYQPVYRLPHNAGVLKAVFTPNGMYLITGSRDHFVRVYDTQTGRLLTRWEQGNEVFSITTSPDSKYIVTGGMNNRVCLYELKGKTLLYTWQQGDPVVCVAYDPMGRYILTGGWDDTARLYDVVKGQELRQLQHGYDVYTVCFSADGDKILTGSFNQEVRLYDTHTGKALKRWKHGHSVYSATFSPNETMIATGSEDGIVRVFENLPPFYI